MIQEKENAIQEVAKRLLKANNTVTCLEIKVELVSKYGEYYWDEDLVSLWMIQNCKSLGLVWRDDPNPVPHRVYSYASKPVNQPVVPSKAKVGKVVGTPSKSKGYTYISHKKALDLMSNNKGRFFSATFTKKDGSPRVMNCQYLKDQSQSNLGYVKVKVPNLAKQGENPIRNVNLQTLKFLIIGGVSYKIR